MAILMTKRTTDYIEWQKMKKWNYTEYRGTCKIEMKREMKSINGIGEKRIIQNKIQVFEEIISKRSNKWH
jgi:hypothetical protein